MISFCTCFYPWYRSFERTEEVFNVLINGLNRLSDIEMCELSMINAGVVDVYKQGRYFQKHVFQQRVVNSFKGRVQYKLDDNCIHWSNAGKTPRFWLSRAIQKAVEMSTNDYIMLLGIDCYITGNFIVKFLDKVKPGKAWVILPVKAESVKDIPYFQNLTFERGYYSARGIVGIHREDFFNLGGYDYKGFLKDRSDSNFYDRMKKSNGMEIIEEKVPIVYHINHPGSHMPNPRKGKKVS